ncbi:hypothetical protein EWM64_g6576 [Hericium alpestre]|uniref:Uncharacterized protein n=1 Tax=Hericium alpestre TaxID=135208 RepID=A0A4Y9ZVC4_9AGAM|nr:hypothetical protein EWM64_g6576 [Hericium alpestre]
MMIVKPTSAPTSSPPAAAPVSRTGSVLSYAMAAAGGTSSQPTSTPQPHGKKAPAPSTAGKSKKTKPPATRLAALAAGCQPTVQAVEANRKHAITPALEAVVEANTLLSGLGFESGGVAAAHAIHNGLTAVNNSILHTKLHGEKVAFGVICQLILDGAPTSELDRYIGLMHSVGLPITFADLGIPKPTEEELRLIAKVACLPHETIWALDIPINEDIVYNTIIGADAAGCDYLKRMQRYSKL